MRNVQLFLWGAFLIALPIFCIGLGALSLIWAVMASPAKSIPEGAALVVAILGGVAFFLSGLGLVYAIGNVVPMDPPDA